MNAVRRLWRWLPVPRSLRLGRRIVGQWIWRIRRARVAAAYRRHEDAEVAYTALHRVHADGSTFDVLSSPFDRRPLWMSSYVDSNAPVFRRRPDVLFSRIPNHKEDWALVLRLSRRCRVVHIPTPTVRYLINPDSHYTDWTTTSKVDV